MELPFRVCLAKWPEYQPMFAWRKCSISHALESVLVDSKCQLTLEGEDLEGVAFRAQRFRGLGFREV